jgi:hypothetical protein
LVLTVSSNPNVCSTLDEWTGSRSSTRPTSGGELDGNHIGHNGESIPVTVRVQWTDGTEGEVNAWTSQRTRTQVCVYRETAPPYHPFWVRAADVRRR